MSAPNPRASDRALDGSGMGPERVRAPPCVAMRPPILEPEKLRSRPVRQILNYPRTCESPHRRSRRGSAGFHPHPVAVSFPAGGGSCLFQCSRMRLLLAAPALRLQLACSGPLYPSRRSLCPRSHAWPRVTGRWQRGQSGAAPLSMAACHRARSRLCGAPYPRWVAVPLSLSWALPCSAQ